MDANLACDAAMQTMSLTLSTHTAPLVMDAARKELLGSSRRVGIRSRDQRGIRLGVWATFRIRLRFRFRIGV